ncbi:nuclear transport factor 2 family protein [Tomitella fengzijianii]|uniref:Steroid delta-isomerase n=1 Tax=Tomitella fengzijianii TaxID=2597660 RepID=A0A516X720_9ACTN|nr:nuclear transport factor 2 family protein [Tomitella fengzijianii]QDQ98862.1 steroid delta-isomerase [Tomitella fengzijianii]
MAPAPEAVRKTIEAYITAVTTGTVDEILALYAPGATVEDPVGSGVRDTEESIREFYGVVAGMKQTGEIYTIRIAGSSAAFHFRITTEAGDQKVQITPIDVMTFDDDAKITSMRAFWGQEDMETL